MGSPTDALSPLREADSSPRYVGSPDPSSPVWVAGSGRYGVVIENDRPPHRARRTAAAGGAGEPGPTARGVPRPVVGRGRGVRTGGCRSVGPDEVEVRC